MHPSFPMAFGRFCACCAFLPVALAVDFWRGFAAVPDEYSGAVEGANVVSFFDEARKHAANRSR